MVLLMPNTLLEKHGFKSLSFKMTGKALNWPKSKRKVFLDIFYLQDGDDDDDDDELTPSVALPKS